MSTSQASQPLPEGLAAAVLAWLHAHNSTTAVEVVNIVTYGTDWAGGTEEGFYATADTNVYYLDADGAKKSRSLEGEELADLWDTLIRSWPSDSQGSST